MYRSRKILNSLVLASLMSVLPFSHGLTQDAQEEEQDGGALHVQLNTLQQNEAACRVTFVVNNELGNQLDEAAFEIALFDRDGLVERMTIVDFGALEEDRTKVRQFDLADTQCESIGRVLVNDATQCSGPHIEADACMSELVTDNRSNVEFGN